MILAAKKKIFALACRRNDLPAEAISVCTHRQAQRDAKIKGDDLANDLQNEVAGDVSLV